MNRLSRTTALKIAAILSLLTAVYSLIDALPYLARGAADLNQAVDSPPSVVIVLVFALAIVKIVAAYGAWHKQRWGVVLTLLANALDTLVGVPGILFGPTPYLRIGSIIMTILGIVIIVLCLWRERNLKVAT